MNRAGRSGWSNGAKSTAATGTSGTQTIALSFEKSPSSTARNTAKGMTCARIESARSAEIAPRPPRTSATPTTPLTASVKIAAQVKVRPVTHPVSLERDSRYASAVNTAPESA